MPVAAPPGSMVDGRIVLAPGFRARPVYVGRLMQAGRPDPLLVGMLITTDSWMWGLGLSEERRNGVCPQFDAAPGRMPRVFTGILRPCEGGWELYSDPAGYDNCPLSTKQWKDWGWG